MKKAKIAKAAWVIFLIFVLPLNVFARDLPPIVSTDWLQKILKNEKLVVLDVRKVEYYQEGHVPGSREKSTEISLSRNTTF